MALKSQFKDALEKSIGMSPSGIGAEMNGVDVGSLPKGEGKTPIVVKMEVGVGSKTKIEVR